MAGIFSGRNPTDPVPADYAAPAAAAAAFATQVVTAAVAVGLDDANASAGVLVAALTLGVLEGRPISSVVPADYAPLAGAIAAAAKAVYPSLL